MLTAEAEKKVKELAKEAAEKAVRDYVANLATSGVNSVDVLNTVVKELQEDVHSLSEILESRVTELNDDINDLREEVDNLKSDLAAVK